MAFDLACPECRTKLRLDERPDPDTEIECPRCGSTFTPAEARVTVPKPAAKPKKKPAAEGKKPRGNPKETKLREGMNPVLLLMIIGVGLISYIAMASATIHVLGKAGRVTDMMAYLPPDCTVVRGANLKILSRYPGYKQEYERYSTPPIAAALEGLQQASGLEEKDQFVDFVLTGTAPDGVIHAIRCRDDFDPDFLAEGLKGVPVDIGGTPCFKLPASAPGVLSGAVIYMPTYRHVVVVRGGQSLLKRSLAGYEDPAESFLEDLSDAGALAMSGHTWVILRNKVQINQWYVKPLTEDKNLSRYVKEAASANELGAWNSFGGKIRFGGAISLGSEDAASEVAKSIREGEYGKGDEAELSRQFKSAFNGAHGKEFGAFMSQVSFSSSGTALVYRSSVGGEQGLRLLTMVDITRIGAGGN